MENSVNNIEEHVTHSKSDNIEIMINDKADEDVEELIESLLKRYQNNLEKLIKGSEFIFNYGHLLHYKCNKINPNRPRSYIDSSNWIKNKKATTNPTNRKGYKCYQYTVTVALSYVKTRRHSKRMIKIMLFINKYN